MIVFIGKNSFIGRRRNVSIYDLVLLVNQIGIIIQKRKKKKCKTEHKEFFEFEQVFHVDILWIKVEIASVYC